MAPNGTFIKIAEVLNLGVNDRVSSTRSHVLLSSVCDVVSYAVYIGAAAHVSRIEAYTWRKMLAPCIVFCRGRRDVTVFRVVQYEQLHCFIVLLKSSSHCQHGQDKIVLSCRRCEQNSRLDKTVWKFGDRKFRNCFIQSRILVTPPPRQGSVTYKHYGIEIQTSIFRKLCISL